MTNRLVLTVDICYSSSSPAAVQYMISAVVSVSCTENEAEGHQMVMQGTLTCLFL